MTRPTSRPSTTATRSGTRRWTTPATSRRPRPRRRRRSTREAPSTPATAPKTRRALPTAASPRTSPAPTTGRALTRRARSRRSPTTTAWTPASSGATRRTSRRPGRSIPARGASPPASRTFSPPGAHWSPPARPPGCTWLSSAWAPPATASSPSSSTRAARRGSTRWARRSPAAYGSSFATMAFGEAKLNLPAVLSAIGSSPCTSFVSMQVHSRSSSSISSALIDYAGPQAVEVQSCAVNGQKFQDNNANGTKDSGDPGLSGWKFYLDTNNNGQYDSGEPTGTTGADGNFHITNVPAGTYTVREAPSGSQQSAGGSSPNPPAE